MRHRELLDLVPVVDRKIAIDTSSVGSLWSVLGELRRAHYDVALDLQGLLKSAVLARLSGAARVVGFPADLLRERAARFFYTETAGDPEPHVIDKNLSMLRAIGVRMPEVAFPLEDRNPGIADEGAIASRARRRARLSPSSIPAPPGRTSGGRRCISRSCRASSPNAMVCVRSSCGDRASNSSLTQSRRHPTTRRPRLRRRASQTWCR